MPGNTDECRRAPGLAEYILYKKYPIFVGHKGQKTENVISEKGEKRSIQTKYLLNAV